MFDEIALFYLVWEPIEISRHCSKVDDCPRPALSFGNFMGIDERLSHINGSVFRDEQLAPSYFPAQRHAQAEALREERLRGDHEFEKCLRRFIHSIQDKSIGESQDLCQNPRA